MRIFRFDRIIVALMRRDEVKNVQSKGSDLIDYPLVIIAALIKSIESDFFENLGKPALDPIPPDRN